MTETVRLRTEEEPSLQRLFQTVSMFQYSTIEKLLSENPKPLLLLPENPPHKLTNHQSLVSFLPYSPRYH
jgi:hypothetical protein